MATPQIVYPLNGKSTGNLIQPFAVPFALPTVAFPSFFLPFALPLLAGLVGHWLSGSRTRLSTLTLQR